MARSSAILLLLAVATVALLLIEGCGGDSDGDRDGSGRLHVLASVAVVEALARAVAGDAADVEVLAGSGTDPHDFSLSPQDRRRIDEADVIVRIGLGFDSFAGEGERVLTLSDGLELRLPAEAHDDDDNEEHEEEDSQSDEHGEADPHVWHDPLNCIEMAEALAARYAEADPANATVYRANAEALRQRLEDADEEDPGCSGAIPQYRRKIVTNHDAFGYFIDRYELTFVGAVIPSLSTAAEPSARQIAELEDTIRREGVRAIFAESSVDPAVARQIAEDTGVEIVDDLYSDSLGEPGSGADTIEGMLLANARKIAAALG